MRLRALALLLMCGCGPVRGNFGMGITSPIAVGAVVFATPSSTTTVRVGLTQTATQSRDVTILSSAIEPADAWQKVECPTCKGQVRYRALRENSGTITVTANDGAGTETFVQPIEAVMPTAVQLFVTPCETMTWQAGIDFQLYLQLRSGARVLNDSGLDAASFAITGGAAIEGEPSALWVRTAAARGGQRITSTLDPSFALPFTVFTPSDVSAIDLVPYGPGPLTLTVGRASAAAVTVVHPGAPACKDALIRKVITQTPDVCDTINGTTATPTTDGRYFVTLRAKKAGTCTLTASVEGTAVAATRDFVVVEPADAGTADGG